MKKKNIFGPILSVAFLLILAAGIFVYINFSDLTKNAIEKIASDSLNVPVKISSLKISLEDKTVSVSNLKIGNPKGYKNPHAVTVGNISITLDKISKELVTFKTINVDNTQVFLEIANKTTNLNDLKQGAALKKKKPSNIQQPKVIIQNLRIGQSQLHPTITLIGNNLKPVAVPEVRLSGIGRKENGVVAREAITQIISQYITKAQKQAGNAGYLSGLPGQVGETTKAINKAKEDFNKLGKDLGKIFGN